MAELRTGTEHDAGERRTTSAVSPPCLGVMIVARDEERSLGPCLDAWRTARGHAVAGARGDDAAAFATLPLLVVLDDCRDRSAEIAVAHGAETVLSSGGKVVGLEGGRDELVRRASPEAAAHPLAFVICSDADVLPAPALLASLTSAMRDPSAQVAFPQKRPLPPRRRSLLARSLFTYNLRQGFASRRTWFSGQTFAIRVRALIFPSATEVAARAARQPVDRFLRLETPLRTDDVYLSQALLHAHGLAAFRQVDEVIVYRGPETLAGMYRRYRRMQAELARVEALFPELRAVGRAFGHRVPDRLAAAPRAERAQYHVVQTAVRLCELGYRLERFYHRHLTARAPELWPPIPETKLSDGDAQASSTSSSGTR